MAWHRPGDKPLSEPMMVSLLAHIYASLGLNQLSRNRAFSSRRHKYAAIPDMSTGAQLPGVPFADMDK